MNIYTRKGFTLIELLIVIAIIGILASVVLISLGDQTDTAKNATQRAEAGQLRVIAQIYASAKEGNYTDVCTASNGFEKPDAIKLIKSIASTGKGSNITTSIPLLAGAVAAVPSNFVFCNGKPDGFIFVYKQTGNTVGCVDAQDSSSNKPRIGTTSIGVDINPADNSLKVDGAFISVTCKP